MQQQIIMGPICVLQVRVQGFLDGAVIPVLCTGCNSFHFFRTKCVPGRYPGTASAIRLGTCHHCSCPRWYLLLLTALCCSTEPKDSFLLNTVQPMTRAWACVYEKGCLIASSTSVTKLGLFRNVSSASCFFGFLPRAFVDPLISEREPAFFI